MALLPSFNALPGERSPFHPVPQSSSGGFGQRIRSPSVDPVPATLVTKYSLATVDSSSDAYNRESRSSLPFKRIHSTPSSRRGTPHLPDFPNHPKGRNPSKRAGSSKPSLPVTQTKPRVSHFQIIPSGDVLIIPAFQERHIKIDDSDEHFGEEYDGDDVKSVPILDAPEGRSQSSVFFRIGNSETSYNVQHPSRSHSASYRDKSSAAKTVVSKYSDQPPAYAFQFEVSAPKSGSYRSASAPNYGHSEARAGSLTRGKYYVDLPDGRRQIVEYYADETGYHPKITYV